MLKRKVQKNHDISVVIIGAGFAGLETAKALANKSVHVTLIDEHNYHLFQPLLYQVATAALSPAEIAAPIRHIVRKAKNIHVFMDRVQSVCTKNNLVFTNQGRCINYDYLVLSSGTQHSYFGRDEWAPIAPGLKTIDDALELRHRILMAFEMAEMETDNEKRKAYLNFVIIGAGPTGVEMAGAIAELARHSLTGDFRHISSQCAQIILVDGGPSILSSFNETLATKAQKHLEELNVKIVLNTIIEDMGEDYIMLGDEQLACRTIIWAAGVQASPAGKWINADTDRSGRVIVGTDLRVPKQKNIFAIGDTASFTPEGSKVALPGVAPVAKQMGQYTGQYILNKIIGKETKKFYYHDYGSMATIGRHKAITDIKGWKTSGFVGWVLWSLTHVYYLVGFRNRAIVIFKWLWAYITWDRGVRLINRKVTSQKFNTDDERNSPHRTQDA